MTSGDTAKGLKRSGNVPHLRQHRLQIGRCRRRPNRLNGSPWPPLAVDVTQGQLRGGASDCSTRQISHANAS